MLPHALWVALVGRGVSGGVDHGVVLRVCVLVMLAALAAGVLIHTRQDRFTMDGPWSDWTVTLSNDYRNLFIVKKALDGHLEQTGGYKTCGNDDRLYASPYILFLLPWERNSDTLLDTCYVTLLAYPCFGDPQKKNGRTIGYPHYGRWNGLLLKVSATYQTDPKKQVREDGPIRVSWKALAPAFELSYPPDWDAAKIGDLKPAPVKPVRPKQNLVLYHNNITIVFAKRLAGAIYLMHMRYNYVEPQQGNGGSMQSALALDIEPGMSPELENPTEAGNCTDSAGSTHSVWLKAARGQQEAYTETAMAYYYPPNTPVDSDPQRRVARGAGLVSPCILKKRVTIGWLGIDNAIHFDLTFSIPQPHWFAQFEILTGYPPREMNTIYTLTKGKALRYNATKYDINHSVLPGKRHPLIMATPDGQYALGFYCYKWRKPTLGLYPFPWYVADAETPIGVRAYDGEFGPQFPGKDTPTSKWNIVMQYGQQLGADVARPLVVQGDYNFKCIVVLGTVAEVAKSMNALIKNQ